MIWTTVEIRNCAVLLRRDSGSGSRAAMEVRIHKPLTPKSLEFGVSYLFEGLAAAGERSLRRLRHRERFEVMGERNEKRNLV